MNHKNFVTSFLDDTKCRNREAQRIIDENQFATSGSGFKNHRAELYKFFQGKMILQGFLEGHEEDITLMTKVQDFLVTGSRDKTLNVYDLRKMKKVEDVKEHEDIVWALNGYDGNVLSGDFNGAMHLRS